MSQQIDQTYFAKGLNNYPPPPPPPPPPFPSILLSHPGLNDSAVSHASWSLITVCACATVVWATDVPASLVSQSMF